MPLVQTDHARPSWDDLRRELHLGERLLKRFRQPAKNQVTILAAFEEEGWPERIDSPLPGGAGHADRLHDAVKKLNRQISPLIRFLSDGTGEGIFWELR